MVTLSENLPRGQPRWYPRPPSTEKIDILVQPNPVDEFTRSPSRSSKADASKGPFEDNIWPTDLIQPTTTTAASTPTGVTRPGSDTSPFSTVSGLISGLNTLPSGADSLFQSFYKTAVSIAPRTVTRTASATRGFTRRQVSSAQRKVVSQTTTATSAARSTGQSVRQIPNQTQTLNAIQVQNQMMMGGGIGGVGGLGGLRGGTGLGSVGSGLGGLGGLTGGHH